MTNVKLKLMFFLLNALLTADIVLARPYSDPNVNNTDIVFKFNNNSFILPVESNSDTLIVAHEDQTSEEQNKNSNTQMEAILNAEQDRDENLAQKVMTEYKSEPEKPNMASDLDHMEELMNAEMNRDKTISKKIVEDQRNLNKEERTMNKQMHAIMTAEQNRDVELSEKSKREHSIAQLETPKKDGKSFEKQLNISSGHMEDIIDAETGREETMTDILFRPEAELVDMPRFEFLIAAKINESDTSNKTVNPKDVVVSDNSLDKVGRNSTDVLKKVDYVELVEVLKPGKDGENKSDYLANITTYEEDNDFAPETRYTDVQTLFLACFATLIPLLGVLFTTLVIRCMCKRYCRKSSRSSASESSEKQDSNHPQLKSPSGDAEPVQNGDGPPANGSIFTMTLKNNHLIVETEERNDITKNGRETKMKYSPDNDGIFVVEVQQSTAYRPNNKNLQNSPPHDPQISTNQALIHRVPEEVVAKKMEEDSERSSEKFEQKALALSSTGLSISDLSMSSLGSHNVSYSYGSQIGYEHGPFGYPIYAGYDTKEDSSDGIIHDSSQEPLISKTPTDPDKPVVTAAIFKQDSIIGNEAIQGPVYCIEGSTDGPLLSDVQAREYSIQHLIHEKKMENGVAVPVSEKIESPKKALNRADSLPMRLEEKPVPVEAPTLETITESDANNISKDALKGKRPSLPIIRTDVYESVKEVLKPPGSPKFEKLKNDTSPAENTFDPPPMITITEESDPGKSDSS